MPKDMCVYCKSRAVALCSNCGNAYCDEHGVDYLCRSCYSRIVPQDNVVHERLKRGLFGPEPLSITPKWLRSKENSVISPDKEPSENTLSLFAVARTTLEQGELAYVGNIYVVQAGVSHERLDDFVDSLFELTLPDTSNTILFDISFYGDEKIAFLQERQYYLRYYPQISSPQLVATTFQVLAPGNCFLTVDFYYQRHLLGTIDLSFDIVETLSQTLPSEGRAS